ncbi:MAG: HD domain-containing phosphohydrolase [Oceanospirillaceae bacterium]
MARFYLKDPIDSELFAEAHEEFLEQYSICESRIVELEHNPQDKVLLDDLFRTIHTVKANSSLLSFEPMVLMLQELESILDLVRKGNIPFSNHTGDLTLLLMDKARDFMEQFSANQQVDYDQTLYSAIDSGLQELIASSAEKASDIMIGLIALIDPDTTNASDVPKNWLQALAEDNEELKFLYHLSKTCEARIGYWEGRTDRIGQLALSMNIAAGSPVDAVNLAASLFAHDIAMAFLPISLLNKQEKLNAKQKTLMRQHVQTSSQLMRSIFGSHLAGQSLMQHQELLNGTGYPNGLQGNDISPAAKIIAIVHTFEAITHGHSSVTLHKRPLMRALLEINKKAGIEFSERWVEIFMKVVPKGY